MMPLTDVKVRQAKPREAGYRIPGAGNPTSPAG